MKSFQHSAVLIILYFYYFKEFALADKTSRIFGYKKEYFGKTCPIVDRLFTMTIRRKTACVEKCARTTGCTAVTFLERNLMCTGCNGFYPSSISLDDQSETLFYIGMYINFMMLNAKLYTKWIWYYLSIGKKLLK
jgi:hypothetical protein